jgi:hypothetical protein
MEMFPVKRATAPAQHTSLGQRIKAGGKAVKTETKDLRSFSTSEKISSGCPILRQAMLGAARRAPRRRKSSCARCHSRRAQLVGDYRHGRPLMDTHLPALLVEGLYHPDGQIDGEVYEYGSFIQGKMYQAGVTCSDCHNPHTLKRRAGGNTLCQQCHFDSQRDEKQFGGSHDEATGAEVFREDNRGSRRPGGPARLKR